MSRTTMHTRLPVTLVPALALAFTIACASQSLAQSSGSTSGGVGHAPQAGSTALSPTPDPAPAVPSTANPATGTAGITVGKVPGYTGRVSNVQSRSDPVVDQTEKEVSKRIKSICRGC